MERGQAFVVCCLLSIAMLTVGLLLFQHSQPAV
ncbi:hypothetical protein J2S57_005215 [Kineosporia succinea]|uniref:NADH dehydrogenase subunit 6 n=1 Tax=Kineosporia succinea TaxID=84632 RepID=A0ABT9P9U9_9ACTN|nr:hypothetical protein [Kineosporia succinea]